MANNSILDINKILNNYAKEISRDITTDAEIVAKEGVSELRNTSPKRTGKYRKGWRAKTDRLNNGGSSTIYNATDYQLTHLLEKPHLKRNGGVTTPQVHIKPVEEMCIKEYEKRVEKSIQNGG